MLRIAKCFDKTELFIAGSFWVREESCFYKKNIVAIEVILEVNIPTGYFPLGSFDALVFFNNLYIISILEVTGGWRNFIYMEGQDGFSICWTERLFR